MQARRKAFRVETMDRVTGRAIAHVNNGHQASHHHDEIMSELRVLRSLVKPAEQVTQQMIDAYKGQITEAAKLKGELDLIQDAINKTKQEIATVHITGFEGPEMARVTNELDAIVGGTESATETILGSAEEIDQMVQTLMARLKDEQNQALASDIQDRVVKIFEACNFQDLTGQRISKVMTTMKFIEHHINVMMEIWGGVDAIKAHAPPIVDERVGDARLLNGPKAIGEEGHASQNDIDAMFG
jgi:chemotaxis protein CheZ